MNEYTSLEVSNRLAEAGLKEPSEKKWVVSIRDENNKALVDTEQFVDTLSCWIIACAAYRADTLEAWLMTHGFFSRRTATLQIAYRAVQVDGKWTGHFFATALNGVENVIGVGEAATIVDALGEVVMKALEKKS